MEYISVSGSMRVQYKCRITRKNESFDGYFEKKITVAINRKCVI